MNGAMDYVDINLYIEERQLYLNDEVDLTIDIKNKSSYTIENGLLKLVLNSDILHIVDSRFNACLNDFINIKNIEPGIRYSFKIPVRVKKIPKESIEKIFCYINFHITEYDQLKDFTYKSNGLDIKFMKEIEEDDLDIKFSKEEYFIEEEIHLKISLKNTTQDMLKDIDIIDCIPFNTDLIEDKIISSMRNRIDLIDGGIRISRLDVEELINVELVLKVKDSLCAEKIYINPILSYEDILSKKSTVYKASISSTINNINIFNNNNFIYKIDQDSVFLNEIITHNLTIKNDTNIDILDVQIDNNFRDKVKFVENSLVIGDIYRVSEDISNPIKLGDIEPDEVITITFKTKLELANIVEDMRFFINYKTNRKSVTQESNSNKLKVLYPLFEEINLKRSQNKSLLKLGDIVDVHIETSNTGTSSAVDVLIKEKLPLELNFVENSLYINGKRVDENITRNGINIQKVEPNEKIMISYKVKAIDICTNQEARTILSYSSENKASTFNTESKENNITVVGARIGNDNILVDLSHNTAQIGDKVTYTIHIKNTGNLDCESLKIKIPYNDSIEFVDKSLKIDDKEYEDINVFDELTLDKIIPNQTIKISYQVEILDFPKPNPICDRVTLEYMFMFEDKIEKKVIYSNRKKVYVNNPILIVKDLNAQLAYDAPDIFNKMCFKGERIKFSLELQNKGNVGIENLALRINNLKNLEIYKDSIKINNKSHYKIDDKLLQLPNLNVSQKIYLDFEATYKHIDEENIEVSILFEYIFRELQGKISHSKVKKIKENIFVINPDISVNKFISDKDIEVGREFTKNINIVNIGNILLEDIVIDINENEFLKSCDKILLLNGNHIDFKEEVTIEKLDVNQNMNLSIRYLINDLTDYESIIPESIVKASYNISSNNLPSTITKKSNKINIDIKHYSLDIKSHSNSDLIIMNTINKYIVNILNNGNVYCDKILLKIELPKEIGYIENSLCVNSKNIRHHSLENIIEIEDLQCNQIKTISFDYKVNSVPYNNKIKIMVNADCEYNKSNETIVKNFKSKERYLDVENIAIDIVKVSSSEVVHKDDILQIQTIINNVGSISIKDIYLMDNLNKNLLFVKDSVFVDGEQIREIDPSKGIQLRGLDVGQNLLLTYEYYYTPTISSNKIIHFSDISYSYQLKNKEDERVTVKSNILYLEGALSTFKDFSIESEYELKDYEPDIEEIISVSTNVKIENYYEINTMKNISISNEESTGKKVILKGTSMDRVEYLSQGDGSCIYLLEREQPFSIFINLPNDYEGEEIFLKPKCDNIFYKQIGNKSVFISSLISIEGSF